MNNYRLLLKEIMEDGFERDDRTGVGSKFLDSVSLKWDISKKFPAMTIRRVPLRIAFEETMMFLRGEVDTNVLLSKDIKIWEGNTTREFLDNQGLQHLPVGSLGTGYSHQWRNFGGEVGIPGTGVDQIVNLLVGLRENPTSRRHVITGWNPTQLSGAPLPPCHIMNMYSVAGNCLNSSFIMRSNDVPFGLPFNIMGYALLNYIFAKYLGLTPGNLGYFSNDAHIYKNQYEMVDELIVREDTPDLPELIIHKELKTLDDIFSLSYTDIELVGYNPMPDVINKPRMAI